MVASPTMPCLRIRSAVWCESCDDWPLISTWTCTRLLYRPSTASSVGIRSPVNSCPNQEDRKSTRLNSSHSQISYAVFCLKKKKKAAVSKEQITGDPVKSDQGDDGRGAVQGPS